MAITVKFFASFREAAGEKQVTVESGKDIRELLEKLVDKFGERLSKHLYEPGGNKLRGTVNILVNGRGANLLEGLDTPLKRGDIVAIFPPISGG